MPAADFAGRSEAREEALTLLYEADVRRVPLDEALVDRRVAPLEYASEIVSGLAENLATVDDSISRRLTGWRIERMPVVDRAIARIAAYELGYRSDVPTGAVLSEAVRLADSYCGDHSRRFLNGVLASVASDTRPEESAGDPEPPAGEPPAGAAVVLTLPTLECDGVRLRPWTHEDAASLAAAWADPLIAATTAVPEDRSQAAAARWISGARQRADRLLAVDLVVADPEDDRVLGEVGLSGIDQGRRSALIGWWTASTERGRGVAVAAVRCFAAWALSCSGLEVLFAQVAHDNEASLAVARSAGFAGGSSSASPEPQTPLVLRLDRSSPTISH